MSVWTLEELDEQISIRKEQLKSMRQSYGITPASGGASRNAAYVDRQQIWKELAEFQTLRNEMAGSGAGRRSGPRTLHATFDGTGQTIGGGDPYP